MLSGRHNGSSVPARAAAAIALPIRRWPERRPVVLSVAAGLFAAIFAWRVQTGAPEAGIALLFVAPVALVALELGLAAGAGAGLLAIGLMALWSLTTAHGLGDAGLATRASVFVFVGLLGGRFSDRMRAGAERQRRLMESGLELARLPEEGGGLAEAAARRARAVVDARGARVQLVDGGVSETGEVGLWPLHIPIEARDERLGELVVDPGRPLDPEDEAALATLATQIAIAADNRRLLASVREKAALEAQLGDAVTRLGARSNQLREVLTGQEDERRRLALRLHEDAAQAMAAIMLGLGALEREKDADALGPRLERLREHVDTTMSDLRNLAVSLRPTVLDLGLEVALERLGEERRAHGLRRMEVTVDGALRGLTPAGESALYRVVEDALDAYPQPEAVAVTTVGDDLVVSVEGPRGEQPRPERLAILGARVDLLGGTLDADGGVHARVPLAPQRD